VSNVKQQAVNDVWAEDSFEGGFGETVGALYAIWLRELKRTLRDRGQLIGGLSRPVLWMLIMGIGLSPYFRGEVYGEVRFTIPYTYLQFIFPAVIVLNIMYTAVQSAVSVISDRKFGFLREVLVSPASRWVVLLGKVLGGTSVAMLHGLLVVALAGFVDVTLTPTSVLLGLGLMFLIAFSLTCLGIFIAGFISSFEAFGVFVNLVVLPLYFTSSSVFPLDPALSNAQAIVIYPEWLVVVVRLNPLTYAVDAMRSVFIGFNQFDLSFDLLVVCVMPVVLFALALWQFVRD
jgi:ABC-2 type transport system permease protein